MKKVIIVLLLVPTFFSCHEKNEETGNKTTAEQVQLINRLKAEVKQNPDSASTRMKLVNALDSLKMYKEAIEQTDSLIARDSLNNGLWFAKAQLLESNKDTGAAVKSYEKALSIYPSVETQLNLANLLAEAKNPKALALCENVSRMSLGRETDASCEFIAGVYYSRTGNTAKALTFFDKAITDNYTLMEAYMEKGFLYYDNRKYAEALKIFETATTVNNLYADAYYWKAKCLEANGNKEEALLNYKRSLGLDKQLKEAAEAVNRLE